MLTLVTGATGLVGNNVVRLLLSRGEAVRVLARTTSDPRPLAGLNVEIVSGDVRDVAACEKACAGASLVIHSAALVHIGWSKLADQRAINVTGTRNIAAAARKNGCRMVHVSSVDALGVGQRDAPATEDSPRTGKTPCTYVITKREAEEALHQEIALGLDGVIVNPTLMFGPWDWKPSSGQMIVEVVKRLTPLAPTGGSNVVDVRDVAEGILLAAKLGQTGRNYILGGDNLPYYELWKIIAQVANKRGPRARFGPLLRWMAGRGGDLAGWIRGREGVLNSAAMAMSCLWHFYTSARAEQELGYHHRPAPEAVAEGWRWFREHGYL